MSRNDDNEVKKFHKKVIILSNKRTQREAYELVERVRKKRDQGRLYKNYDSYRNSICKRRKTGKI